MEYQTASKISINENLLLGAGPDGVSGVFATDASKNHHSVAYITHKNSKYTADNNTFMLASDRMNTADNYLLRANKSVHRSWPSGNVEIDNNLRRDSYIVRWCERVYAIGVFTNDASLLKIAGDSAWACQMYIDRFLYDQEPISTCELYFFDLKAETWLVWNTKWSRNNQVPKPHGIYAVLGQERLTRAAKISIDQLWQ